jgi:hypothetical protein
LLLLALWLFCVCNFYITFTFTNVAQHILLFLLSSSGM